MAGIYGVFVKNKSIKKGFELFSNSTQNNVVKDELIIYDLTLGRCVLNKLNNDRFFEKRDKTTICFEGVNVSKTINSNNTFFDLYLKEGVSFVKKIRGTYSGFIFDETINRLYVFNDNLSTKSIFYYYDKSIGFIFSSELGVITKLLRKEKIKYTINTDAVYQMALYGFLLEDNTYAKEVKKLNYSSIITFDTASMELNIENHQKYSNKKIDLSYSDALFQINELMEKSITSNWNKDKEYTNKHISLLSGGMDARVNVLIAKELGFNDITTITFGQLKSKDIKYAQEIAKGEGLNHFQRQLDGPKYLIDNIFENYIVPNDGLMMFQTSAHTSSTVKSFNLSEYNTLHTGQIGDVLFGSFSDQNFNIHRNKASIGYTGFVSNNSLLNKIESLPKLLDKYQELGFELFIYEQRQINATLVGDRSLNNHIDNVSPFYDLELINFCLSLPNKFKKNQMIYFDWLNKYHKQVVKYPWDKIDMIPNNRFKIIYGKTIKKYVNGGKKYFNLNYDSMNPYHKWLKEDLSIIHTLDSIISNEIDKFYIDKELKEDLITIYDNNIFEFRNKFAVATALLALKLHFDNV